MAMVMMVMIGHDYDDCNKVVAAADDDAADVANSNAEFVADVDTSFQQ